VGVVDEEQQELSSPARSSLSPGRLSGEKASTSQETSPEQPQEKANYDPSSASCDSEDDSTDQELEWDGSSPIMSPAKKSDSGYLPPDSDEEDSSETQNLSRGDVSKSRSFSEESAPRIDLSRSAIRQSTSSKFLASVSTPEMNTPLMSLEIEVGSEDEGLDVALPEPLASASSPSPHFARPAQVHQEGKIQVKRTPYHDVGERSLLRKTISSASKKGVGSPARDGLTSSDPNIPGTYNTPTSHQPAAGQNSCSQCSATFMRPEQVKSHLKSVHGQQTKHFQPKSQSGSYVASPSVANTEDTPSSNSEPEVIFVCGSGNCGWEFLNQDVLFSHVLYHETEATTYGMEAETVADGTIKKYFVPKDGTWTDTSNHCEQCLLREVLNVSQYWDHIRISHLSYRCRVCQMSFYYEFQLMHHVQQHIHLFNISFADTWHLGDDDLVLFSCKVCEKQMEKFPIVSHIHVDHAAQIPAAIEKYGIAQYIKGLIRVAGIRLKPGRQETSSMEDLSVVHGTEQTIVPGTRVDPGQVLSSSATKSCNIESRNNQKSQLANNQSRCAFCGFSDGCRHMEAKSDIDGEVDDADPMEIVEEAVLAQTSALGKLSEEQPPSDLGGGAERHSKHLGLLATKPAPETQKETATSRQKETYAGKHNSTSRKPAFLPPSSYNFSQEDRTHRSIFELQAEQKRKFLESISNPDGEAGSQLEWEMIQAAGRPRSAVQPTPELKNREPTSAAPAQVLPNDEPTSESPAKKKARLSDLSVDANTNIPSTMLGTPFQRNGAVGAFSPNESDRPLKTASENHSKPKSPVGSSLPPPAASKPTDTPSAKGVSTKSRKNKARRTGSSTRPGSDKHPITPDTYFTFDSKNAKDNVHPNFSSPYRVSDKAKDDVKSDVDPGSLVVAHDKQIPDNLSKKSFLETPGSKKVEQGDPTAIYRAQETVISGKRSNSSGNLLLSVDDKEGSLTGGKPTTQQLDRSESQMVSDTVKSSGLLSEKRLKGSSKPRNETNNGNFRSPPRLKRPDKSIADVISNSPQALAKAAIDKRTKEIQAISKLSATLSPVRSQSLSAKKIDAWLAKSTTGTEDDKWYLDKNTPMRNFTQNTINLKSVKGTLGTVVESENTVDFIRKKRTVDVLSWGGTINW
jgi:hypothetical protein